MMLVSMLAELRRWKQAVVLTPSGASWRGSVRGQLPRSTQSSMPRPCTRKVRLNCTQDVDGLLSWGLARVFHRVLPYGRSVGLEMSAST